MLKLKEMNIVRMDKIRTQLYGERADTDITATEHLFKNEVTRYEILKLLVCGVPTVLNESVMLTVSKHQEPFVQMISKAQGYVEAIECEQYKQRGLPLPLHPTKVNLRVLLFFASPEVIAIRAARGHTEERTESFASFSNLRGMWNAVRQFEFPDNRHYSPLLVDTTDESLSAEEERMAEIQEFLSEGKLDQRINEKRLQGAKKYHSELISIISKLV